MKRGRENEERVSSFEAFDMTKYCLMLLSQNKEVEWKLEHPVEDVFECKTCHRQFPSFQALGGHRASHHKKPRLSVGDKNPKANTDSKFALSLAIGKPKVHACAHCGKEFSVGQALGGHMRKHRASTYDSYVPNYFPVVPMLSRSSNKRVLCLDLNLTPSENDLEALVGNMGMAPELDLHF